MRRKILPGRNPICKCGHKRSRHWKYIDAPGWGGCQGEKKDEEYCHCSKFLDRRYVKIDIMEEILDYVARHGGTTGSSFFEIEKRVTVSMPTISRRCSLYEDLKLFTRHYWGSDMYRDGNATFTFNRDAFNKLRKEKIIV